MNTSPVLDRQATDIVSVRALRPGMRMWDPAGALTVTSVAVSGRDVDVYAVGDIIADGDQAFRVRFEFDQDDLAAIMRPVSLVKAAADGTYRER